MGWEFLSTVGPLFGLDLEVVEMHLFRIALIAFLILGMAGHGMGGEPGDPAGPGEGDAGPVNGNAPEGMDLDLGAGGSAQLQFADGTSVNVKENSKARVSREKKGGVPWSYLSFDEGMFQVEGQNGPLEYILPGFNVLGVGATFQVTVKRGDKIKVEVVNMGPGVVVGKDVLTDMEFILEPGVGIRALVDKAGGRTKYHALPGNAGDLVLSSGEGRESIAPGATFESRDGSGGLLAVEEARIDVKPPTDMVEYRYTVNTGTGGAAEFTFRDGGHAYVKDQTRVALSVVKRKDGAGSKSMVNLQAGRVGFDLGTGGFLLETEVVAVLARSVVFFAEATESYDRFRNERGERILVKSKKDGPSKGMLIEVKAGTELLVKHGPDVPGVVFEVPEKTPGEVVFKVRGKVLRMPAGSRLTFGESGRTVTVSVPTPESEFSATLPLPEFMLGPGDASLQDTGDLIPTGNVSP